MFIHKKYKLTKNTLFCSCENNKGLDAGNITYKSDWGCYTYNQTGNAETHAVISISGHRSYNLFTLGLYY